MNIKKTLVYLSLAAAGGFSVFAFAPVNHGLCLILSFLALLFYTEYSITQSKLNFNLLLGAYCFGFGLFVAQLYWFFSSIYYVIGAPLAVAILAIFICNGYLALYVLLSVWLYKRLRTQSVEFNYLVLFPSTWVLGEWLRGWIITGFSWCDLAYAQVDNFLMQGYFPLIGSYGVSWLTMSIIGFVFIIIKNRHNLLSGNARALTLGQRIGVIYFVLIAITGYFLHGKQYTEKYGKPVKIAMVQGNIPQSQKWSSKEILNTLGIYSGLISKAKADIVLLPETAFVVYSNFLPQHYLEDIVHFAESNGAELVIGMPKVIDKKGNYVNAAVVVTDPKEKYYAKSHLVPYGEYTPFASAFNWFYSLIQLPMVGFSSGGENQPPLVIANQKVAFNICYENGFGSELISAARQSTLMINISDMVWYGTTIAKDLHLQLSQARAMENQRYFIQETNTGITAIIDPFGKIVGRLPEFQRMIMTDSVSGMIGITPYQKYGNYPIVTLCSLILLLAFIIKFYFSQIFLRSTKNEENIIN